MFQDTQPKQKPLNLNGGEKIKKNMYVAYKKNTWEPPTWRFQNNLVHTRHRLNDVMKTNLLCKECEGYI